MEGPPDPPAPNSRAAENSSNPQHVQESEAASLNPSPRTTNPNTNNINPSIDVSNGPTRRSSRRQSQNEAGPQDSCAAAESSSKIHVSNVNQTVVAEGTNQEPPNNPNSNDEQPTKPKSAHKRKMPQRKRVGIGSRTASRGSINKAEFHETAEISQIALLVDPVENVELASATLTPTQMKRKARNQARTIDNLRSEISELKSSTVTLQSQLSAAKDEVKAAAARARDAAARAREEVKAAAARARDDKKAANEAIAKAMAEAQQINEEAAFKMKEAEAAKMEADRYAAGVIQAERSYSSQKVEAEKSKGRKSLEREQRAIDAALVSRDRELDTVKSELEAVQLMADTKVRDLKRKHSEVVVKMKSEERDRKKKHGDMLHKKNGKLSQMNDMHDQRVVEMQEFLDEMADDVQQSIDKAADATRQKKGAIKDANIRLSKMRASVIKMNAMKDDLAKAVSTILLHAVQYLYPTQL